MGEIKLIFGTNHPWAMDKGKESLKRGYGRRAGGADQQSDQLDR